MKEEELAERGTAEFYREQVSRILSFAEQLTDTAAKLELLSIAATFQRLADRSASGPAYLKDVPGKRSA